MQKSLKVLATMVAVGLLMVAGDAFAAEGRSAPWQMWLQEAHSPSAEGIHSLHDLLFTIEVAIVVFVLAILAYILVRFNSKANPVPAKFSHNTLLEVVWTAIPIVILVIIAVPSLKLLYYADHNVDTDMTLKVTGNQWFWTYEYPDQGGFVFDSLRVGDDELEEGQPRMLAVDQHVVLPVDTNVRLLFASNDVIHNWAIPSLGIKIDTTPGRVNETWVNINQPGDYYGMCSELCGVNHGFMPIHVKAVSKAEFAKWVAEAKEEFASADTVKVARANVETAGR
jgi:cytochrome c oxidase subunit 2